MEQLWRLKKTLNSFLHFVVPSQISWELVVVNNNSTDETFDVISAFSNLLPIKYVEEPTQGLSHARNSGLIAASGELIVFTDDDVGPCSDWLYLYWQAYQLNPDGRFWGGPIVSEFEAKHVNPVLLSYSPASVKGLWLGNKDRELKHKEYLLSANWACPASAIKKAGSFDVSKGLNPSTKRVSIGEETDLMDRLRAHGYRPFYLPSAEISHFVPKDKTSLKHIAARSRAWGFFCGTRDHQNLQKGRRAFGVPFWLFRELLSGLYGFSCSLLKGRIDYKAYLEVCRLLGYMESVRKHSAH